MHPKPTTRGLVGIWEHLWVLGQATGTLTHLTHHGLDSGEATTFPHIVYYAALCRGYIQMAIFLRTPKEESRNCLGLESRHFGSSYLSTANSDWSEVWTNVVALLESFPTPCHTPSGDVGKRSIPASLTPGPSFAHNLGYRCPNGSCEAILDIYTSRPFPMTLRTPQCKVF
jgi:hypothetical protein